MAELDTSGDGHVDDLEWLAAQRRAKAEVRTEETLDRVVIARGESGESFFLSDRSEKELVRRLRWESAGMVLGGGGGFVGCVAFLLSTASAAG